MMKKLMTMVLALMMVLCMVQPAAAADTTTNQVVDVGGTVLYNAAGQPVSSSNLGDNGAVVKISKTIEQYVQNGVPVENEFVVTLQVQTSQNLKELASDTPDTAVLLVFDVSNSMDDCVHCGQESSHGNHTGTSTTYYLLQRHQRHDL